LEQDFLSFFHTIPPFFYTYMNTLAHANCVVC
jgi:hypothetical protein